MLCVQSALEKTKPFYFSLKLTVWHVSTNVFSFSVIKLNNYPMLLHFSGVTNKLFLIQKCNIVINVFDLEGREFLTLHAKLITPVAK